MTSSATLPSSAPVEAPVIVLNSYGNYHVYPATVEGAKALLQKKLDEAGPSEVAGLAVLAVRKAFADAPADLSIPYMVPETGVLRGMKDLLSLDIGQESRALYRLMTTGPLEKGVTVPITKFMRDELVLWMFENKFKLESADASTLEELHPEKTLSFLSGVVSRAKGHVIQYVPDEDMAEADELEVLLRCSWKPTALVENVVQRYLTMLNELSGRDEKYDLGTMSTPVA